MEAMVNFLKYSITSIKGNYIKLFILSILSIILSFLTLYLPLLSGNFINSLIENPSINTIIYFCKFLIIINLLNIFISYIIVILNVKTQINSSFALNCRLLKKMQRVSMLSMQKQDIPFLNQRINNDCNSIVIFIINLVKDVIINGVTLIISSLFLFNVSNRFFFCFSIMIILYFILYKLFKNKILEIKRKELDLQGEYFSKLQEQLQYIKFIKIYDCGNLFMHSLNKKFFNMKKMIIKNQNYSYILNSSEQILVLLVQIFLFIYGGIEVIKGNLSIGMFTVMSSYFSNVVTSIKYFSNLYQQYLSTYVSYTRLIELENLENDNVGNITIEHLSCLTLKNITFSYDKKNIINNFSYNLKLGNIYQICGENGKGKSTLINLIIGLYTDYLGEIEVNGINTRNLNMYDFRKNHVSIVTQNPLLVNGTTYDNIVLENHYDKKDIINYLLEFNLVKDKKEIDNFLSRNITDFLKNVSGGENQKLSIIRELLRDRTLIIFDEPTSALDFESKNILVKYISQLKTNHIIILITHDIFLQDNLNMIKINL